MSKTPEVLPSRSPFFLEVSSPQNLTVILQQSFILFKSASFWGHTIFSPHSFLPSQACPPGTDNCGHSSRPLSSAAQATAREGRARAWRPGAPPPVCHTGASSASPCGERQRPTGPLSTFDF